MATLSPFSTVCRDGEKDGWFVRVGQEGSNGAHESVFEQKLHRSDSTRRGEGNEETIARAASSKRSVGNNAREGERESVRERGLVDMTLTWSAAAAAKKRPCAAAATVPEYLVFKK